MTKTFRAMQWAVAAVIVMGTLTGRQHLTGAYANSYAGFSIARLAGITEGTSGSPHRLYLGT